MATLGALFIIALVLVVTTIVLPLRGAVHDVGGRLIAGGTTYFLLIGVGFMMAEIGLLQRMSIFLGHPIYSLSVLLFAIILATGAGSLLSDRLTPDTDWRITAWAVMTAAYIFVLSRWLSGVLLLFEGAGLGVKIAVCIATIAPAGLLMGFAFPTGMRLVSAISSKPTPWYWGINGAAGVLASVVAVATSLSLGISGTLTIAAICYLLLIPPALTLVSLHKKEVLR
jgi:hypothetical protein